jgi:hypothetical protein
MRAQYRTYRDLIVTYLNHTITCNVDFAYTPGDPGVRYYPDGSGCPPTPPEIDLHAVFVQAVDFVDRSWLVKRGWAAWADNMAFCAVEDKLQSELYDLFCAYVERENDVEDPEI